MVADALSHVAAHIVTIFHTASERLHQHTYETTQSKALALTSESRSRDAGAGGTQEFCRRGTCGNWGVDRGVTDELVLRTKVRFKTGGWGALRLAPVEVGAVTLARRLHKRIPRWVIVVVVNAKKKGRKSFEWKAERGVGEYG